MRLCYTCDNMKNQVILKIKIIQQKNYVGENLEEADRLFLVDCLKAEEASEDNVVAALLALMEADRESVLFFIKQYKGLRPKIQKLAIPMLVCTDEVDVYLMLLNRLKESDEDAEVEVLIASLAKTHFPVEPLIVQHLITDNELYLKRLKLLLKTMGFERLKTFLLLSPQIPFEAIFIDLFGEGLVANIKQKK